jgi:hypothetical protein
MNRLYSPGCLEEEFSETRIQPVASLCFRTGVKGVSVARTPTTKIHILW